MSDWVDRSALEVHIRKIADLVEELTYEQRTANLMTYALHFVSRSTPFLDDEEINIAIRERLGIDS